MPVVTFEYNDFIDLFGYNISKEDLINQLPMIGADLDKIEGDTISIEFFPDRPDLSSVEGIARASRAFFGFKTGLQSYQIKTSDIQITVEKSVKSVRPYVQCALVKNVTMTDELIASLMQLQEKLHFGIGRNRKKIAIGVHNYNAVQPPFTYKGVAPNSVEFIPLGKSDSMTLEEILTKHEKGIAYAHLLQDDDLYPLIVDANNNVLSFPPIINGMLTEVTPFTTDLFIDVTGNNLSAIQKALVIVTTALSERGGTLFTTQVIEPDGSTVITPNLQPTHRILRHSYVNKILGTTMKADEIIVCLEKMGFSAENTDDDVLKVSIPAWRGDILHEIDLIEEVSIGYGFDKFHHTLPNTLTFGKQLKQTSTFDHYHTILVGLGFNEVTTFTISNETSEFTKMGQPVGPRVEIENPIGDEYSCLRVSLLPSLLKLLAVNKHHPLPQQIYELGIIVDESFKNQSFLSGIKTSAKANFTECKSIVEAIMRDSGNSYSIQEYDHPGFVKGRCAGLIHNKKTIGFFGELHPQTITNFELEHPTIAFEIYVHQLI